MPKRFPKQMWNVRAKLRSLPDYMEPNYWANEMLRSESPASALRRVQKANPFKRSVRWEVLPVQGPELPAPLEEYRLRERARQEEADRQARRDALLQMRSAPGPWKFELPDNEAAAMRGMGDDTYWRFNAPSFKPREYEGEHIRYTLYGLDSDGDELDDLITSPKKSTVTHTIKELLPDYGRIYNGMHVTAILYDKNDRMLDSEVVWSTDQNESSGTDEGSSNNFVSHGNHLQQIYPRFDTDPRDYLDEYDPPARFRTRAIKGIEFRRK